MSRFARWFWLGCSIHFFGAYHSYFSWITDSANRHIYHWDSASWFYALAGISLMGLFAVSAAQALKRHLGKKRAVEFHRVFHLYVLVVVGSVLARDAVSIPDKIEAVIKLTLLGTFVYYSATKPAPFSRVLVALFTIISPTIIVFFLHATQYKTFETSSGEPPARMREAPGRHITLVLFDAWAYARAFSDGKPLPRFPNLSRIATESIVLHRAYSPRTLTLESIPRMLSLKPLGVITRDHMAHDHDMARVLEPNLFGLAQESGFRQFILGNHIPYSDWYGRSATYSLSFSMYRPTRVSRLRGFLHTLWLINLDNLILKLTGLSEFVSHWQMEVITLHNLNSIHAAALKVLEAEGERSLSFFHYPIPHSPVPLPTLNAASKAEREGNEYGQLLDLADVKLGEIIDRISEAGRWDNSLIIITSDHGTEDSVNHDSLPCRMPVLIKLPGQKHNIDSYVSFDSRRLRGIIKTALVSNVSPTALWNDREIKRLISGKRNNIVSCGPLPYPKI